MKSDLKTSISFTSCTIMHELASRAEALKVNAVLLVLFKVLYTFRHLSHKANFMRALLGVEQVCHYLLMIHIHEGIKLTKMSVRKNSDNSR
jgi:hypothetical protein